MMTVIRERSWLMNVTPAHCLYITALTNMLHVFASPTMLHCKLVGLLLLMYLAHYMPSSCHLHGQVDRYAAAREQLGLPADARAHGDAADVLEYVAGREGLTAAELAAFVRRCIAKYESKRVDPGELG